MCCKGRQFENEICMSERRLGRVVFILDPTSYRALLNMRRATTTTDFELNMQ